MLVAINKYQVNTESVDEQASSVPARVSHYLIPPSSVPSSAYASPINLATSTLSYNNAA